jgi:uncharacterized protein YqgC (DUF456 family)
MSWLILIFAIIIIMAALLGCFLPVIPGPPLAFLATLLLSFSTFGSSISNQFLLWAGVGAVAITLLDYFIPMLGTRTFGGSKAGVIGSVVGLLAGIFLFPPLGIIVGPFIGAVFGEMLTGNQFKEALRSGFGAFLGFVFGTGIKLAYTITMIYFFFDFLTF